MNVYIDVSPHFGGVVLLDRTNGVGFVLSHKASFSEANTYSEELNDTQVGVLERNFRLGEV